MRSSAIHFDVVFAVSIPFTRLQLAPPELKLPTSSYSALTSSPTNNLHHTLPHSRPPWGPR